MIASCSKDCTIIVWKVITKNVFDNDPHILVSPIVEIVARLDAHKNEVWRLSWNILATCLASSGDDGTVRIWKRVNVKGKYNQIAFQQIACLQSKS